MKKLIFILLLFTFSALAFAGTNVPPCDPNHPTNCTDYFGVANWANSPLPAGSITGFTVVSAGSGYSASTVITITDMAGAGATAPTLTFDGNFGIATITGGGGGTGYIAPQVTVVDYGPGGTPGAPNCGGVTQTACGSGAVVTATIGGTVTGGIRKFVDQLNLPLANITLAVPDSTTFPGSDFYAIGLQDYTAKMHTDLPLTKLRGYCQLTAASNYTACAAGQPSYLGPTIVAAKNRPVRVFFKNMLGIGTAGNLFIPVDTTYMGAGPPYTENRATLHLHGGATPWISDGTPHQWTTPSGEAGPARGDSVQMVPDMWFDASGNLIASCAGQSTCSAAGATNDPGPGSLTFFWTNQQGGRLMFYHDHAYGITRLNVYAGEAAGYLLADPTEEDALAAASVPGTVGALVGGLTAPDLNHLVPLVIQDKTFVPSATEIAAEDPTWTAGGFGTTPGSVNPGDLWFPHVYTPNQNPADVGGGNPFGRWDYGPWTLPGNQTVLLAANPETATTIPCTSSAFPNQAVGCPITPNPSGTPEGFMDTPLVNGKAYPVLHVAPEAYRFRILSAGNDRSWNLQLYLGDPAGYKTPGGLPTEVRMVPAVQPPAGSLTPLCTTLTPITNTILFMGIATATLDATGNPINGTGLPLNCWPNFGAGSQTAGIPIQQTMWAADGRFGGAPDPTMAGPPFIQIGTEGGLLPAPVVIPSMPTGYEANTRSVTITNVSVHGLWLGPAERADAIVDFTQAPALCAAKGVNPCTLILYNDAPTPAPAVDSRVDYFTGDGDQTPIGGAPNTLPGYGPNTRTIMQIVVDQTATGRPFSLPALTTALPSLFAKTQPVVIVPEPTYPPASGGFSPTPTYSLISDESLTFYPVGSTTAKTILDDRKTIQELFTLDYGRMNATLGVELPLTNFLTQTTIPLGYIDPFTEVIHQGDTQLWHITHNGVDTHFIHFHLFNVQVINRSAWDGTKRPPDENELGWKDTVRMNPLEDILVALQPITPALPFPIQDSYRLLDVTMPAGSDCPAPAPGGSPLPCSIFTDVNPANNNPFNTPNVKQDFGWEYVWHCHILGHEENDMMRAIAYNVPPEAPSNLTVAPAGGGGLTLSFTDNSASETGFTLERADDATFKTNVVNTTVAPLSPDSNGQGITWGGTVTTTDSSASGTSYFYRVSAFKPEANYWLPGAKVVSGWSNVAAYGATTSVSPMVLPFGTVPLNTGSTILTVTLSNSGNAALTYSTAIAGIDFAVASDTCLGTVSANSSCAIGVTFTPTLTTLESASLVITTSDPLNPTFTVSLNGTGGGLPLLTITANNTTMRYGAAVPPITFSYSPANPVGLTTPATCSTTATRTSPVGMYPITCSGAVDANYTITYVAGTVSVTPAPLTIWASDATMLSGSTVPVILPLYVGLVAGDTATTFQTAPNAAPTCTTTATSGSAIGTYPSSCTGASDTNYTISYATGTVTVTQGLLTITAPTFSMPYGGPIPTLTPIYSVNPPAAPFTAPGCTTSVTIHTPVGTYPGAVVCSAAVDPNYTITYVAGDVTVTAVPLLITPPSPTMTYGGPLPTLTPTYATFVAGDTAANLTPAPTCTTTATANSPVGTYSVSCTGAADPNYAINYGANGTLTVTPASLTITASSASVAYGSGVPTITPGYGGFKAGDTAASLTTPPACSTTYATTPPNNAVGSYPSTCSGAVDPNYNISYVSGTVTVTQIPASVTPNANSKIYGQADPAPITTGNLAGFLAADGVTATYSRVAGENAGTYTISATLAPVAVLGNYTITYNTALFTINKASSTTLITANTPNPVAVNLPVTVNFSVSPQFTGVPTGNVTVTSSTGEFCSGALTAGTGSCQIVFVTPGAKTLTATYAGDSNFLASASAGVQQAVDGPVAYASPTALVFANQLVGTTSAPQNVTLTNLGNVTMTITSISVTGGNAAAFPQGTTCGGTLRAGRSCQINVRFGPPVAGALSSTLAIATSDPIHPVLNVPLSGTGVAPINTVSPPSIPFGSVARGTTSPSQTVTVTNTGTATMTINSIRTSGANANQFNIVNNTCAATLAAGANCTLGVTFRPTSTGNKTASLNVNVAGPAASASVSLTGSGQ